MPSNTSLSIGSKTLMSGSRCFKTNPPPQIGRWRVDPRVDDRNRVHVVAELQPSEVKGVKDFLASERMKDVFRRVNAMSTAPLEFIWLEEVAP